MVDYADIGKRIRACRLAKGMTQEQLANEVGVVVTHISHIETGNSVPSLKTLIDIINALDCSADELLCIEIKKAKPVFDSWMTEQLADCSADEAKVYTVAPDNARALSSKDLAECVRKYHHDVEERQRLKECLEEVKQQADKEDVIIICGTLSFQNELK